MTQTAYVRFDATAKDRQLASKCVTRARKLLKGDGRTRLDWNMDLIATHANGCPMDFAKLLNADDFNFMHDVCGIARHLDRRTGKLTDFFLPRCAAKTPRSSQAA